MYTTIQKWGNSQAIRLPKAILEMAELHENDKVEIKVQDGNLVIVPVKKHRTLEERIAEYSGGDYRCSEWDTGKTVAEEVF
ncbi:AbrB/MazE/SpoVT family DNA-binding domain-containing protein [Desulfosporosinus sp. BICA1-9]|uniref:AbrB/MazE/SpoVT family DNA-binding domain-containing protein n=1 Tax=Desulfosporosinus sp. BICA1-9 TaxID=1531958 RepID=UPI00054B0D7F|nr:AbrB/MazE/SpoVT family DNA-binding domain-containing protein [Desulfosporosinus sp. BICA1-9]KJS46698.1 MAG: AbrB family transcriptional regulator [Peptococcaceae bacterium BRH_c23]KJS83804.1 MAG: AbrB family transcriptional regulator [Desulfosporosinus sp. BICA1-9]HBW36049.1 AbrB/MazE/SpoVT family DNA-binding domain-containing protein [Desulfosporosinus sp.]